MSAALEAHMPSGEAVLFSEEQAQRIMQLAVAGLQQRKLPVVPVEVIGNPRNRRRLGRLVHERANARRVQ